MGVLAVNEVILVARDAPGVEFTSSSLTAAAIFYLVFTLPLIWRLNRVIAREQRRASRGAIAP